MRLPALGPADLAVFGAFWLLIAATAAGPARRAALRAKTADEWVLDVGGLLVQGLLVPVLQVTLVVAATRAALPAYAGALDPPPWLAFAASFVAVDYLFYWNHRLLHGPLWDLHKVHHSMTDRDVLGTSRNTLWTSFLICYLWVHGVALALLADPTAYLAGVAATSALDLWRHSEFDPPPALAGALGAVFVLPRDHAWHHAADGLRANFGANLKLWDRLHGTLRVEAEAPARLGIPVPLSTPRRLLWPFAAGP